MTTYFISDLHLTETQPEITACFLQFLNEEAIHAEALYILGDLFEVWIGDDEKTPLHQTISEQLSQLHRRGVQVYFINGNRDVMLGKSYAEHAQFILLPECHQIDLYGVKTLILHGDTLCIQDLGYQNYRKKITNPAMQWFLLHLPLWLRKRIGTYIRESSVEKKQLKPLDIMDVDANEVSRVMKENQTYQMIHGHTHRPAIHEFNINDIPAKRIVLGDWYTQGSILVCNPSGCTLQTRQFHQNKS